MKKDIKKNLFTKKRLTRIVENALYGEENLPYYVNKGNKYLDKLKEIKSNVYNKVKTATVFEAVGEINELKVLAKNLYNMSQKTEDFTSEFYDYFESFDILDRPKSISDLEYNLVATIESVTEDIYNLSSAVDGLVEAAVAIKNIDDSTNR